MAFNYGFYNSLNGDRRYKAEDFGTLISSLLTDGVFENIGQKLFVTAGTGMDINVGSGKAWFDNTWSFNDSTMVLEVPQSDITRPRYDTVVLDVNTDISARENKIMIVSGSPQVNPTKPVLINTSKHHQHPLAHIYVAAAATEVTASNIEIVVGQTACPFVTSILQKTDITDLYNKWEADFTTWFNNLKSQLTSNVVTNLQSQIDSLREGVEEIEKNTESSIATLAIKVSTLQTSAQNAIDAGSIFMLANRYSKTIENAIPCTGGSYSLVDYQTLFDRIKYAYGANGSLAQKVEFQYPIAPMYMQSYAFDNYTKQWWVCATTVSNGSGTWYLFKFNADGTLVDQNTLGSLGVNGLRLLSVAHDRVLCKGSSDGDYMSHHGTFENPLQTQISLFTGSNTNVNNSVGPLGWVQMISNSSATWLIWYDYTYNGATNYKDTGKVYAKQLYPGSTQITLLSLTAQSVGYGISVAMSSISTNMDYTPCNFVYTTTYHKYNGPTSVATTYTYKTLELIGTGNPVLSAQKTATYPTNGFADYYVVDGVKTCYYTVGAPNGIGYFTENGVFGKYEYADDNIGPGLSSLGTVCATKLNDDYMVIFFPGAPLAILNQTDALTSRACISAISEMPYNSGVQHGGSLPGNKITWIAFDNDDFTTKPWILSADNIRFKVPTLTSAQCKYYIKTY